MVSTSMKAKAPGKGKQPKRFLEQRDTALQLASIIADQQEYKAKEKVEKHYRHDKEPARTEHKSRVSAKDKLKDVKAALKAEAVKARKEKVRAKKQETKQQSGPRGDSHKQQPAKDATQPSRTRKRVAFA